MKHSNGRNGNNWIVVNHDGQKTLFQLIEMGEMGKEADVLRFAGEFPAPAIVVDIALPALPVPNEKPGRRSRAMRSRLILLNVRTVTGDGANSVVRFVPQEPGRVRMTDAASPDSVAT